MGKAQTKAASKPAGAGLDMGGLDELAGLGDMSFGSLIDHKPTGAATPASPSTAEPSAEPLMMDVADIVEDPDQPRTEFDLTDLTESVRANLAAGRKPFKQPLSLRPHPALPGKWIVNDGARRYRVAVQESIQQVPYFRDDEHDNYDQVIVNIQRDGHTPMEIANFIKRRLKLGEKKGFIAKRLGKPPAFVTKHAALIAMPEEILCAYDEGRCNDVEALYLLVNAFEKYPDQITELCLAGDTVISKYTVMALLESLANPLAPTPEQPSPSDAGNASTDAESAAAEVTVDQDAAPSVPETPGSSNQLGAAAVAAQPPGDLPTAEAEPTTPPVTPPQSQPETGADPKEGQAAAAARVRKPVVQVSHDDRPARLLLERRAAAGVAWIRYDDDGSELQIDLGAAKLVAILDGA
jgi:ParB family chromosome partitioning protein